MDAIGEAIAALIELVARGVIAIVELSLALLQFVLQALGFSVDIIASKPAEGESRWSLARLGLAFVPWGLGLVIFGGTYGFVSWRASITQERIAQTQQLIQLTADQLDHPDTTDPSKGFAAVPSGLAIPKDAWGESLTIELTDSLTNHVLVVRSSGPDKQFNNFDDLVERRYLPKAKVDAAINVGKSLFNLIRDKKAD